MSEGLLACFPGLVPPAPPALLHLSSLVCTLSHTKYFHSRFAKVNPHTDPLTYWGGVTYAGLLACFPGLAPPAPPALLHLSSLVRSPLGPL